MREVSDRATREVARVIGALIFGAASIAELLRSFVLRTRWEGLAPRFDAVWTLMAVAFWIASALVLATRTHKLRVVPILGAFVLLCHGLLGTIAGSSSGIVYIVLGLLMAVVERLAFGGKLHLGTPTEPGFRPSSGQREIL